MSSSLNKYSETQEIDLWIDTKCLIKEAFQIMDTNADGYLNYQEAKAAMKALGLSVKKSFVLSVIRMYDKRGDETICFPDFYYIVSDKMKKQNPVEFLKYAFKTFIINSFTNTIGIEDLQKINETLDYKLTMDEMQFMIKEFDINQDGFIDETEFIEMMNGSTI